MVLKPFSTSSKNFAAIFIQAQELNINRMEYSMVHKKTKPEFVHRRIFISSIGSNHERTCTYCIINHLAGGRRRAGDKEMII